VVWNIKSQEQRFVDLIPNDDWGGAGLLGVTIRLDNYGGADERLIRVLEVEENSPASVAGLIPMKDFLLGTTVAAFGSTQILATVLEQHIDRVVEIYVYNSDSDIVRVVGLMPSFSWGGKGLLGAEVGTGYLHRLPNSCRSTIGQSVERKVRWMNKKSKDTTDTDASKDEHGGEPTHQTMLEMEPHLEMEVEKDVNNQHLNPEDVTKQPHELGSSDDESKKKTVESQSNSLSSETQEAEPPNQESVPAVSAAEPTISEAEATSPLAETTASAAPPAAEETAEPQPVATSESLAEPPIISTATSAEDAAALFSGPPPPTSSEPNQQPAPSQSSEIHSSKVSFLPSPPKMTY
jgi:hypothetical protein